MSYAICWNCGSRKDMYSEKCVSCGVEPSTDDEIAASLILSSDFQMDAVGLPKSDDELREIGEAIAAGQENAIAMHEVEMVREFLSKAAAFQARWSLMRVVLLFVFPVMLLVVFVGYLFWIVLRI